MLARRSVVSSWECLQSTPAAIAVILQKLLIRRFPFPRLAREIAQDYMEALRFKPEVINALNYAAESHLARNFENTNLIA